MNVISLFCLISFISKKADERRTKRIPQKQKKAPEEPPSGYVHVRARRGEATDSHSLAERVNKPANHTN